MNLISSLQHQKSLNCSWICFFPWFDLVNTDQARAQPQASCWGPDSGRSADESPSAQGDEGGNKRATVALGCSRCAELARRTGHWCRGSRFCWGDRSCRGWDHSATADLPSFCVVTVFPASGAEVERTVTIQKPSLEGMSSSCRKDHRRTMRKWSAL